MITWFWISKAIEGLKGDYIVDVDTKYWGRQSADFWITGIAVNLMMRFYIRINGRQWITALVVMPKRFFAPKNK